MMIHMRMIRNDDLRKKNRDSRKFAKLARYQYVYIFLFLYIIIIIYIYKVFKKFYFQKYVPLTEIFFKYNLQK